MSRVLILSSWVSVGHVGLSAAVPVLQALGHHVTLLPTILLSNHPGWPHSAVHPVPAAKIMEMLDALDANGWLKGHDAVLTGYLPSAAHVDMACTLIERVRQRSVCLKIVVDPIVGDRPNGLYLNEAAAVSIRDKLVPMAHVLTPNLFELGWLTGIETSTMADTLAAAAKLTARGGEVLVTSPPVSATETGVLSVRPDDTTLYRTPLIRHVPHGVGDVFSGLIAAGLAVDAVLGHLQALVHASAGFPHLRIVEAAESWKNAAAVKGAPYSIRSEE